MIYDGNEGSGSEPVVITSYISRFVAANPPRSYRDCIFWAQKICLLCEKQECKGYLSLVLILLVVLILL